ncbi:MAG: VCBS repeat-containing protein, partial [Candidatus Omnitrophica bacterium]|nr:VCBS repeat-containing protein [Candidatus Omnitrophota bacterium]
MAGGDTLILMDGTYRQSIGSYFSSQPYSSFSPPNGSQTAYTIVRAERDGGAILERTSIYLGGPVDGEARGSSYVQIEGLTLRRSNIRIRHSDHVKIMRTGVKNGVSIDSRYGEVVSINEGSHHVLLEDVWVAGTMVYGVIVFESSNVILRRVVVRFDGNIEREPKSGVCFYGAVDDITASHDSLAQNVIAVDFNPGRGLGAGMQNVHAAKNIRYMGSIALNIPSNGFLINEDWPAGGNEVINSVVWDVREAGIVMRDGDAGQATRIDQVTVGRTDQGIAQWSGWKDENTFTSVRNSLFLANTNRNDQVDVADYNWYNPSGHALGTHSRTDTAQLASIVETPDTGTGEAGSKRGASVLKRYGRSGTLWGEPGYDVLTDEDLWPWPHEERIHELFAEPDGFSYPGTDWEGNPYTVVNNPARGFAAPGETLTQYVRGYLTNVIRYDASAGDRDGDGLPDTWEAEAGLNPGDPRDAAADPDGDHLTNLEEYRLGFDPRRRSVLSNLLASWPRAAEGGAVSTTLGDLDGDRDFELLSGFMVEDPGNSRVYAWDHGTGRVEGWPVATSGSILAAPTLADVDSDRAMDVMVGSETNKIYAWNGDGTPRPGWPVVLEEGIGAVTSSIAVDDINRDGALDAVFGTAGDSVCVLTLEGAPLTGWPVKTGGPVVSSPAIADILPATGLELIAGSDDGTLYCWSSSGQELWHFQSGDKVQSSPAVGDLDRDGNEDIAFGSHDGRLYVLESTGALKPGWPRATSGKITSSPALGDLDRDGDLEVVVGSEDAKVYAWHHSGAPVSGWPRTTGGAIEFSSPAIADIDGDGGMEVIVGSSDGKLHAWHHSGRQVDGFPKVLGASVYASPMIADVDQDGDLDIAVGSSSGMVYVWDVLTPFDSRLVEWGMFRLNARHTGWYRRSSESAVVEEKVIGGQGGIVYVESASSVLFGTQVSVPENGLSETTAITVSEAMDPPSLPEGIQPVGPVVDLGPDGTEFNQPAFLKIPYTQTDLDRAGIQDKSLLKVYQYDETVGRWVELAVVENDTVNQVVTVEVGHFSLFSLGAESPKQIAGAQA